MINKKIGFIILSLLLTACASQTSQVIIAPEIMSASGTKYQGQPVSIKVQDMRSGTHVLQVLRKDKAAQLHSSQEAMSGVLLNTFSQEYKKQGLTVTPAANNEMTVFIDAALISVQQEMLKYKANSHISLRIQIENSKQTLTKTFNIRGNSHGPLQADIAVLERDFNQQLAKLIGQVLASEDIQQFIR